MKDKKSIRKRMICLQKGQRDSQATEACAILNGLKGIYKARPIRNDRIALTYTLEYLSFELIEALLNELNFKLDNSFISIIRRNIYQYLEDNAREKLNVKDDDRLLICQVDPDLSSDEPDRYWNNYR